MAVETARLYLITPPLLAVEDVPSSLGGTLEAGDVACLLVNLATADAGIAKKIIQKCLEIAQPLGTAVLIEADATLAVRANADGVHFRGLDPALKEALKSLQPQRIVGIGGLKGRDDAMSAGEAGVDYLMFGEPTADGFVPPVEQTIERAGWWAEIFNIPCIAYAGRLADVAALSATGADFIALGEAVWADGRGAPAAIHEAQMLLQPLPER